VDRVGDGLEEDVRRPGGTEKPAERESEGAIGLDTRAGVMGASEVAWSEPCPPLMTQTAAKGICLYHQRHPDATEGRIGLIQPSSFASQFRGATEWPLDPRRAGGRPPRT